MEGLTMKNFTTAQRLEQVMKSRNMRQVDILNAAEPYCKKYGIKLGKNDMSQYVSGKVEPGQDKLTILGLALNVSEAWLMGYDVPMERKTAPIPMEEDERSKEFVELFNQLSTEQKKAVLYVMKGFLEKQ